MIARENIDFSAVGGVHANTGSVGASRPSKAVNARAVDRRWQGELPSPSAIRAYLEICPRSGLLRWREKPSRRILIGSIAGTPRSNGRLVGFQGAQFSARVLAFVIREGRWPSAWRM